MTELFVDAVEVFFKSIRLTAILAEARLANRLHVLNAEWPNSMN